MRRLSAHKERAIYKMRCRDGSGSRTMMRKEARLYARTARARAQSLMLCASVCAFPEVAADCEARGSHATPCLRRRAPDASILRSRMQKRQMARKEPERYSASVRPRLSRRTAAARSARYLCGARLLYQQRDASRSERVARRMLMRFSARSASSSAHTRCGTRYRTPEASRYARHAIAMSIR